jgi:2,4-dienoyl-CoA reductase (NADPH2)
VELKSIVDYLEAQIRRRKVDVQLNYRQTAVGLLDLEADLVIVATGAIPPMPNFPEATVPVLRPWDVLRNVTTCGNGDVLVVDDGTGFWPAVSAADALAGRGCRVTLTTPAAAVGANIPVESATHLHRRLRTRDVTFRPFTTMATIAGRVAVLQDVTSGHTEQHEVDFVVVQTSSQPVRDLVSDQTRGLRIEMVGDCWAPRRLSNAIFDANRLMRNFADSGVRRGPRLPSVPC